MHIQTSNSKVSAAEKMHMTTKRKGNHEAKKKNNAVYVRGHESTKSIDANIAINSEQPNSE